MTAPAETPQHFRSSVESRPRGGIRISLPFDPDKVWGALDDYHVRGTIGGQPFRGSLITGDVSVLELGPSWCRTPGFGVGDLVDIRMALEGPRSHTIGDDVSVAFRQDPGAAQFFDSMPTFYRNNAARAIAGAKRPETRARRIAEVVDSAKRRQRWGE
jgi:hypothetical protein